MADTKDYWKNKIADVRANLPEAAPLWKKSFTQTAAENKKTDNNSANSAPKSYSYTVNKNNQPYVDKMNDLYAQYMARGPFQYDLNGDMLYRQMADQYTQLGQQAMMDTMGQASALTGGYGNSYAQSVGNQAYQQYLAALNDQIPSLYQQAYNVWQNEGDRLLQMYELAAQHPGMIEALSPRTYTYSQKSSEESSETAWQELIDAAKLSMIVGQTPAVNELDGWYYKLLNTK